MSDPGRPRGRDGEGALSNMKNRHPLQVQTPTRVSHLGGVRLDLMPAIQAPHKEPQVGRHRVAEHRRWPTVGFHLWRR
jgi:hypothetical protein